MPLYEAAIALAYPGQGPLNHYALDEASGTQVTDTGPFALHAATNGTVTRGHQTGLSGDPDGKATGQSKDTPLATRADNGIFDRPGTTNQLSLIAWFRPDDLRSANSSYALIMKGSAIYGLVVEGGRIRADISTQVDGLRADMHGLVVPGVWNMAAQVFDGAARTWRLYFNGVEVGFRELPSGQTINHAAGGTLQLGGSTVFGSDGIHGRLQHVTIFNAQALPAQQLKNFYQYGVIPPGSEGDGLQYAFPWSREVVPPGGGFESIDFVNHNPWSVSLSKGGTAVKGGGVTIGPRGGRMPEPSEFDGGWSGVLCDDFGHGPLEIIRRR